MASLERFKDMHDVALKPRILRTLLRQYVPDEKQLTSNPLGLSKVVSIIRTHKLLSEFFTESLDQKQVENWKSGVNDWVNRLLALVSSNMPDKCWAGICLLGLTCQDCSSDRFLASYSNWFHKVLAHIQPPADSQLIKVAACTSMSDLFTRLGNYPNIKKDGTSLAGKLIQPVLKLLNEDTSEAVWEGAINLLCRIVSLFPASLLRYYDNVEIAIASKILSTKCSDDILKKLAHCLALLPRSRGDEESWFLMIQKILLTINSHLNDAFQGLEEENKCNEAIRLLVPPGKDPPPLLGGQTGDSHDATQRLEQFLISRVSILMICCSTMLTSPYPVQVTVPIQSLLALVERVLMVDGSLPHAMFPFMTSMQQEFICSELPVLHIYSLELLTAIVKSIRSQLLPHAACIVRLITRYFRKCTLPDLRIRVYSITRMLLISMGVGMAIHLAQEVINNASSDLKPNSDESCGQYSGGNFKTSAGTLVPCRQRKRKHGNDTGLEAQLDTSALEVEVTKNYLSSPISVKIAALEALEALLTVGGALRSESWRSDIDILLMKTATNCFKGRCANQEPRLFLPYESTSILADFQLAAFRALLASLLSPSRARPAYLAQCLELFRRGKQETGTKLAEFCAHALLALELLIHPRALPLDDVPSVYHKSADVVSHKFPENMYSSGQQNSTRFTSGIKEMGYGHPDSDDDDDLYNRWLENGNDVDIALNIEDKNAEDVAKSSEAIEVHYAEKHSVPDSSGAVVPEITKQEAAATNTVVQTSKEGEMMHAYQQIQESTVPFQEIVPAEVATYNGDLNQTDHAVASRNTILAEKDNEFSSAGSNAEKVKTSSSASASAFGSASASVPLPVSDDDASLASLPDILEDMQTDSDEELSSGN